MNRWVCQPIAQHRVSVQKTDLYPWCNSNERSKVWVAYQPSAHCASCRGKQLSLWHLGCILTVMLKCNTIKYEDLKLPFLRHQFHSQNISLFTNVYLLELDYVYDGLLDGYPETWGILYSVNKYFPDTTAKLDIMSRISNSPNTNPAGFINVSLNMFAFICKCLEMWRMPVYIRCMHNLLQRKTAIKHRTSN